MENPIELCGHCQTSASFCPRGMNCADVRDAWSEGYAAGHQRARDANVIWLRDTAKITRNADHSDAMLVTALSIERGADKRDE